MRFHGFVVVAGQVEVHFLARRDFGGRFAAELLRIEVQDLAVQHFDGAFVAHEVLAIAVMIVAEIATVVDVELAGYIRRSR